MNVLFYYILQCAAVETDQIYYILQCAAVETDQIFYTKPLPVTVGPTSTVARVSNYNRLNCIYLLRNAKQRIDIKKIIQFPNKYFTKKEIILFLHV